MAQSPSVTIEPPEAGQRLLDQSTNRTLVSQIRLEGNGLDAARPEGFDAFRRLRRRTAVMNDQRITTGRQRLRDMPADAALPAAGHEGHLRMRHRIPHLQEPI